jgi:outer membrane receptor protein involved in Fe transport
MKFLLIFFSILAISLSVTAQGNSSNYKGAISGKVTDASTKLVVNYATISILKPGSTSPFNGGTTDEKGNFKIDNIPPGTYTINIDFIGYTKKTLSNVVVGNTTVSLGNILLAPAANELAGVTIKGTTPTVENKIDKLVYNPQNDLTSQGGVALDVLQKVPMVTVDINNNVELMGNTNIQFLINGKPSTMFGASITDALQAIPANQIKSIEVITNPGAKYDASGTGGIINIILKDSKVQGVNGSVNLTAGTRLENGSFNLNARKGNFGVNAFFSGNESLSSTTPSSTNRTSYSPTRDTVTQLNEKGSSAFKRSGYRSGIDFNWDITPKDELTAAFNYNHFGNQSSGYTDQNQTTTFPGSLLDTASVNNSTSKFSNTTSDGSLFYKKTFKRENQELDILYNYSYSSSLNDYSQDLAYTNVLYPQTGSIGNNPGTDKETDISIDYVQPFTKSFSIETGGKLTIENLNNVVNTQTLTDGVYYVPDPLQSYSFNYDRKIYAYYLSATFSLFHDFLDGKAGLREEYTTQSSDFPNTTLPSYGVLAPSFVLQHKLDKSESVKFSYSYRLQRPNYSALNPFYNVSDPHNISTGDPNLKPELGHNFELGYNKSYDGGANINVTAFYRYNTNDLQSFTTFYQSLVVDGIDYSDVSLTQQYNIGKQVTEGVNLFGSLPLGKLSLRSNMLFDNVITTNPGDPQVSGFAYRINLNASYDFGHNLAGEFFINYRSSQVGIQGKNPGFVFYNFAVRKQFWHKNASIGLTAVNPFNEYVNVTTTTYGSNFDQSSLRQIPLRSFGISLMYKFGKLEFKNKPQDNENPVPDDTTVPGSTPK